MTLLEQTTLIRSSNPSLSFDAAWQKACSMQRVQGSFGRPTVSADAVLVAQANGLKDPEPPKTVAAAVPKSKGALVEGGFFNLLPGMEEIEEGD